MQIARLKMENFRGIKAGEFEFDGHVLLIGQNNVGKSTICEALELALGPDRQSRVPVVDEYDFYNARYLDESESPVSIRLEVLLIDVTPTVERLCFNHLERWDPVERRVLQQGELNQVDDSGFVWCLRLLTIARYNEEEDEFEAYTHYAGAYNVADEQASRVPRSVRRTFGFIYLRTLRTGSRALSLERGSLLDVIIRTKSLQTGIWESVRNRLENLDPPIEDGIATLAPVLAAIEARLAEYMPVANPEHSTSLYVSQLTREHLRRTLSFFLCVAEDQRPVPFQEVGTGTLNALVLALLSFIAELKDEGVIFAMEEPEIALPPHTQRRVTNYLITKTTQCFVTSHSPYVIECFEPERISILRRDNQGAVTAKGVELGEAIKAKTYRRYLRRGFAEAMLGAGVIVAEGVTEQLVLRTAAEKLESANPDLYPLDLAGVTVFTADGDGGIPEFGRFFVSLDLPTFAFMDKKTRGAREIAALGDAGFAIMNETPYEGMEALIATEVPLDHQWAYLEGLRDSEVPLPDAVPASRPTDDEIRRLVKLILKSGKGSGRAAELLELCEASELPVSVVSFLDMIYERFPRPKVPTIAEVIEANDSPAGDDDENQEPEVEVADA